MQKIHDEYVGDLKLSLYMDEDLAQILGEELKDDEDVFLTAYHREFTIESDIVSKEGCRFLITGDEGNEEEAEEIAKKYHHWTIEAYIHGGVSLDFSNEGNYPDRRWDVSNPIGLIFVKKIKGETKDKAKEKAGRLLETYNQLNRGEVYGYIIEDDEDEVLGGEGGFLGDEEGCLKEGQAEAEMIKKERTKEKAKMTKEAKANKNEKMHSKLSEMLLSDNEAIKRHAKGIYKELQK